MAVAYASSNTTNFTSATSITIAKPTGLEAGDLMIAFIGGTDNSASNYTFPANWTEIDNDTSGGESWRAGYKVADSGDAAATNFTFGSTSGEYIGGSLIRVTGAYVDFTVKSKQRVSASGGVNTFNTADLTPAFADSLLLFYTFNISNQTAFSGYACVTSNPTWTEAFDFGSTAPVPDCNMTMAYASRPEVTATGDFSGTSTGTDNVWGFFIALAPLLNVTISPSVLDLTLSVQAPVVTGGATITVSSPLDLTLSLPAPTVTTPSPDWTNPDKSSTSTFSNPDKS